MSKNIQMTAAKREGSGKGTAREVRRNNLVPAVIYGDSKTPVSISLEVKPLTTEYHKGHLLTTLCDLNVAGEKHLVIARDVQLDPVTDKVLHVDFLRVTSKTSLRVEVPVHFTGHEECPAFKSGATLTVIHHEITLLCPANAIPEEFTIDLTGMEMGHSIKLSDLKLPSGVKAGVPEPEAYTIATLSAPRVVEEVEATPAADAAAPAAAGDAKAAPAADAKKDEKK